MVVLVVDVLLVDVGLKSRLCRFLVRSLWMDRIRSAPNFELANDVSTKKNAFVEPKI